MVNVPHLFAEERLEKMSDAIEKLEEGLKIDIKAIFDGVNKETNEIVNMHNMDLVLKIGLPVYFLGSPSVIDHIEIEEDICSIRNDIAKRKS